MFILIIETICRIYRYVVNLEWTERVQHNCVFCDRANFHRIDYEDKEVIAVENLRLAGRFHWLILPKLHLRRDIEGLTGDDLILLQAMDRVKNLLIDQYCSGIPDSEILSGYHRGRRPLVGKIYYPDVVSIHHIHLHVIVQPHLIFRLFKYPAWLPLMWKSDAREFTSCSAIEVGVYAPLVDEVACEKHRAVWAIRDLIRGSERGWTAADHWSPDYMRLTDLTRHTIHVFETLELASNTVDSILAYRRCVVGLLVTAAGRQDT